MNDSLWKQYGENSMSKNLYMLSIGLFTAFGIFVSMMVAQLTLNMQLTWPFVIIVLVLGIAGVIVNKKSDNPFISLVGYMMVAVPYGALLGPFINLYVTASIIEAFFVTTLYVAAFGLIGAVIPDSLDGWQSWIVGALLVAIAGYFVIPLAGFFGLPVAHALGLWDWAIVVLFAFIIMYDFNKALRIPYTLDNAIDVALAVYLDWFNVFVRYLSGRGKRK